MVHNYWDVALAIYILNLS